MGKEMPYTQEATIRVHYKKLKKFIRLVDYLILDSKMGMINNSLISVDKYLESAYTILTNKTRNNGGLAPILIIKPEFSQSDLIYNPSLDRIVKCLDESISRGLNYVSDQHSMLVNAPEFSIYSKTGDTQKELGPEQVELHQLMISDDKYTALKEKIGTWLGKIFGFIVSNSDDLRKVLNIVLRCKAFNRGMIENQEREWIVNKIEALVGEDETIKKTIDKQEVGIFSFEREDLKKDVLNVAMEVLDLIEENLPDIMTRRADEYSRQMQQLFLKLSSPITDVETFINHMRQFDTCKEEFDDLTGEFSILQDLNMVFSNEIYRIRCPEECRDALTKMKTNRDKVKKVIDEIDEKLDQEITRYKKELTLQVPQIDRDRMKVEQELDKLDPNNGSLNPAEMVKLIEPLKSQIDEIFDTAEKYQKFQLTLNMEVSPTEDIADAKKKVHNYHSFWSMKLDWDKSLDTWEKIPVKEIDVNELRKKIDSNLKKINVLLKDIENVESFKGFKDEMEKNKGLVTVLEAFATTALGDAEWKEINNLFKGSASDKESQRHQELTLEDFDYHGESFMLPQVFNMNMLKHKNEIYEISMRAAKEKDLRERLSKIKEWFTGSQIKLVQYKNEKEIYVLGDNEEFTKKLDSSLVDITNILSNKYVTRIKSDVLESQKRLVYYQQFYDEVCYCQRMWMYLEPIFTSEESNKELAKERAQFLKVVHKPLTKIMKELHDPSMILLKKVKRSDPILMGILEVTHAELEVLDKKLINYLERKRKQFPRFYFISNDDLIEILSQAKDFEKVQGHLNKLFDAIKRVGLDSLSSFITMISPEGEEVRFDEPWPQNMADPINDVLEKIQDHMTSTVILRIKDAIKDLKSMLDKRIDWVMGPSCAQAILTTDCLIWTMGTEGCLESGDPQEELDHLLDSMEKELKDVIEMVRTDLPKQKRRMINSLITQDVHYKDITEMLLFEEIDSKENFKWQQQLRFYQVGQTTDKPKGGFVGRQVNTELAYGNEYLGVPSKLAITPLTDRCWMTITSALYLQLGCAPQGPAGTGKTESVKDLAKNLGTFCIVYNCSEQVTVQMMSTQFLGIMMTGAWICLDEFNRIDIAVLSVIAQQILSMRHALALKSNSRGIDDANSVCYFDGHPITYSSLNNFKNLTIFTTMNPGYAGRTELPDNLKVLFRNVSMMVPDYALIAEILLYSEGFFNAKDLAVKMTKLYKLASEQLSQQRHYDFGMRAVKSILTMAGTLKRQSPDEDEDLLLIEAMKDTNIPKFLEVDIKLFEAIVQDLFPGKVHDKRPDEMFMEELNFSIKQFKLEPLPSFIEKCCQYDAIMKIRFGNMLIGPPMCGKSSVLQCLRLTYQRLSERVQSEDYLPVDCMILNPKSITMGELYGEIDPKTGDFSNGLASKIFADFASREKKERKWIVFDGPVDSLWIENLNSVLDDSMTLCLANAKRIKLKFDMRVLFEAQDLAEASPATVSRIGIVYMGADTITCTDLIKTKFATELESLNIPELHKEGYISRADMFFDKILNYLRKNSREPLKTIDNCLVTSFCRIIKTFYQLGEIKNRYVSEDEEEDKLIELAMIGKIFIFASTWSVMSTVDEHSSLKMDQLASNLFNMNDLPRGSMYDCYLNLTDKEHHWVKWDSMEQEFEYTPTMRWSDILVPTVNTKRFSYLLKRAIMCKYPMYLSGITGTGKTVICHNVINSMNSEGLISNLMFTFSAKTSSHQVQAQITGKLNNLRRDKITPFGVEKVHCLIPKNTPRSLVVYIDDVNMPEVEQYGAQPPIELLRQTIDQNGFYDRQVLQWREIEDTIFVATSVPPGNGRAPLSDRFMRHFHILNIQASSDEIMKSIFGKIIKNFFDAFEFNPKIKGMDDNLVTGTLLLFREMVTKMLPTPKKSHYIFNLRDVSKVFQGLVKMRPQKFISTELVAKLWIHECTRVFADRLATHKDREYFANSISSLSGTYGGYSCSPSDIIQDKLLFGDFMNPATRDLEYLDKMDKMIKTIHTYMENTSVSIELFGDSVKHLCRLNRLLRQVGGHGLLIGVGGSGKKSLVTVAAEMAGTNLRQIEPSKDYDIKTFRKDVFNNMLSAAGHEGKEITFLLTDSHIVNEGFLEEVNNLINTGELVLDREEMDKLKKGAEAEMAKLKISEDPVEFFVKRVKDNLHIMLAMSPVGDTLRTRVLNFPSFVNCCTIDWLDPWPVEALSTVAKKMLEPVFLEQKIDAVVGSGVCGCCVDSHLTSIDSALDFLNLMKRRVFITPKTYIDLIKAFQKTLSELKGNIEDNINKLTNGLSKLIESGEKVEFYKEEIARMQPVLAKKTIEVEELSETLTKEKDAVSQQFIDVEKEKAQVQVKAEQISEIKQQVDTEYARARPILENAIKALDVLSRNDIAELKLGKLQGPKKEILDCMQIFLGRPANDKGITTSLSSPNLIDQLRKLRPRDLTKEMTKQVNVKLSDSNMVEDKLKNINFALVSLFKWLKGMIAAQESDEIVRKMEAKADEVSKVYSAQMARLKEKQDELDEVSKRLQQLQDSYDKNNQEKVNLDNEITKANMMLENSGKLKVGLADEHVRWVATVKELEKSKKFILGDAFLAAACLAYHGPFTGLFRQSLLVKWMKTLAEHDIQYSEKFAFEEALGDISTIREWNVYGLPSNKISVCNGVLVSRAASFPYMIDPQLQANKWIKKMESDLEVKEVKLSTVKANDSKNLSRVIEACIQNNIPCLIEDADDALDPFLDPLLLRKIDPSQGGKAKVKLGTSDELEIEPDFRLYFTTKIANPNFLPELFIRVSIINFMVTEDGLEEQLLAEVVKNVMPADEERRISLVMNIAKGKNTLRKNEDDILRELKNSKGNILENTPLVINLENSKLQSEEIKVTLEENEFAQKQITAARDQYRPVAVRGGLLYFIICDLSDIQPMYQFSLNYVTRLFVNTINECLKLPDRPKEAKDLCELFVKKITENIYLNVCQGLFNDHKKIFAFLVASKIQKRLGNIKLLEWDLFLKGIPLGASYPTQKIPPAIQLPEQLWQKFFYLSSFCEPVKDLTTLMLKDTSVLNIIVNQWLVSEEPLKTHLPKDLESKISVFQKMLIAQSLRPESVLRNMIDYVK